jgi:hypothetical protein
MISTTLGRVRPIHDVSRESTATQITQTTQDNTKVTPGLVDVRDLRRVSRELLTKPDTEFYTMLFLSLENVLAYNIIITIIEATTKLII